VSRSPRDRGATALEAAAVATDHLEDLVLGSVRDVHTSVAGRVHGLVDRVAGGTTLPHRVHDGVAVLAYGAVRTGLRAAGRGLREADRLGLGPTLDASPRGRFLVSAINGLIGDRLRDEGSGLAIEIGIRDNGADVTVDPAGVAAGFPDATDALVVFVHGLCETEETWDRGGGQPSYGARLAAEEGWSPVYVRVNTGLPVAESGVALSALLARLVEHWPTEVRRIAFVGHSMGGLITRAACAVHTPAEHDWKPLVTDIVTLGTPHLGSPVERAIERGMRLSRRVPELSPYARVFERRSAGVLDLHDGLPDDAAQVPQAHYHLVAATLSRSPRHPVAETLGDYLVPFRSAIAKPRGGRELFPRADVLHVPGAHHFDLLNHEAVHTALLGWLRHRSRKSAVGEQGPPTHGNGGVAV
jgi:pimeloyl-ACP methyl ester carboxylesterase